MIKSLVKLVVLTAALAMNTWALASGVSQKDPHLMVEQLSNQVLVALDKERAALEADPTKVSDFANQYVLPYVDARRMARYVMARYWRVATPSQQQAFVDEFTTTLLRSYAVSLLKLKIAKVDVKSTIEEKPGRVVVSTSVIQADGNVTQVAYRAFLDKKTRNWMLYDVAIEGISMLINYRTVYGLEFNAKGIDGVIANMRDKNKAFSSGTTL